MQYMIKGMQPPVPYMPMPRYILDMDISSTAKILYAILLNRALIVTSNLTLQQLREPQDLDHARIYDRVLERCVPVWVRGKNIRQVNAADNMEMAKELLCGGG